MKRLISVLMAVLLLAALSSTAVLATGDEKPGIGNDPVRLALTQCSNAGAGNGPEEQLIGVSLRPFLTKAVLRGECLKKKFNLETKRGVLNFLYASNAIAQHTTLDACEFAIFEVKKTWYIGTNCDIDPGNSAWNNNAGD